MDLLGNETQKEQKTTGQKIVLMLLIICVILCILILITIFTLKGKKTKPLRLRINGQDTEITQDMLIKDEKDIDYISLQQISKLIGYNYLKGEYMKYEEDENKCYLENGKEIIGFEANSNKIYKTTTDSILDYEYYNLKNKIIKSKGILYIALDLEDLSIGCNVIYSFSNEEYKIIINTPKYLLQTYESTLAQKGLTLDTGDSNEKSIIYNLVIAANETGRFGVLTTNLDTIIGHRYRMIQFENFPQTFIVVSSGNKYGIISKEGNKIADLEYDSIRVINHSPLLYEVKLNNKVGVLDKQGNVIINTEYDKLGFLENSNLSKPILIVKNINNGQNAIIVCNDSKYGLIDIETGQVILDCSVEKIYSKRENSGEEKYYVQFQNQEIELNRYLEYVNQVVVVTN